LSSATDYTVEWGVGDIPQSWKSDGIVKLIAPSQNLSASSAPLATWNTGTIPSGSYSLRVRVTDGTDENVIERVVKVTHERREVATTGHQFTSIQAALNASAAGDTVVVYPGTYAERITLKSSVSLVGSSGAIIAPTAAGYAISASGLTAPTQLAELEVRAAQ